MIKTMKNHHAKRRILAVIMEFARAVMLPALIFAVSFEVGFVLLEFVGVANALTGFVFVVFFAIYSVVYGFEYFDARALRKRLKEISLKKYVAYHLFSGILLGIPLAVIVSTYFLFMRIKFPLIDVGFFCLFGLIILYGGVLFANIWEKRGKYRR